MTTPKLQTTISARLAAAREIAAAILIAANSEYGFDRSELIALATRIQLCNDPDNIFLCNDAINMSTGEVYQAKGNLWRCGSKLCPNCISSFAASHRRRLRQQIERVRLLPKERWHFGTMTIPNPNLSLTATRELVNYAWSLYRKRLLSVSLIRGGAKSEEFTLTANGYHYHLHTLYIAPWHQFQEVRRVWTECVTEAFLKFKVPLTIRNKDGLCSVTIKLVTNLDQVVNEVCKYITKSDSWYKMPVRHLAEVGLVRRWWRMFELFGCMRADVTSKTATDTQATESESILDTSTLSDGVSPTHSEAWRTLLTKMTLDDYLSHVKSQWATTIYFRRLQIRKRWPYAQLFSARELGIT